MDTRNAMENHSGFCLRSARQECHLDRLKSAARVAGDYGRQLAEERFDEIKAVIAKL